MPAKVNSTNRVISSSLACRSLSSRFGISFFCCQDASANTWFTNSGSLASLRICSTTKSSISCAWSVGVVRASLPRIILVTHM